MDENSAPGPVSGVYAGSVNLRNDGISHLGGENIQLEGMNALQWMIKMRFESLENPLSASDVSQKSSTIMKQYSDWLISGPRNHFVQENSKLQPKDVWGLMSALWPDLALNVALPLACFPATPCGGERNFKVMSRIDSDTRIRLGNIKSDKQVACDYNSSKLKLRELPNRDSDFSIMLQSISGPLSAMSTSDLNRYEQIMLDQRDVRAVAACIAPSNDLDLSPWSKSNFNDAVDGPQDDFSDID